MFYWIDEKESEISEEFSTRQEAIDSATDYAEDLMTNSKDRVDGLIIVQKVEVINVLKNYSLEVNSTFVGPDTPAD